MKLVLTVTVVLCALLSPAWAADTQPSEEKRDPVTGLTPEQFEQAKQILNEGADEDPDAKLREVMPLLGALLTGMLTHHQVDDPYVPSGDALFDVWGSAVMAEIDAKVYTETGKPAGPLPSTVFDDWEKKFGDDPRYWELRYLNGLALFERSDGAVLDGSRFKQPVDILLEADKRGATRANTLLLIWQEQVSMRQGVREKADRERAKKSGQKAYGDLNPDERKQWLAEGQLLAAQPLHDIPDSELDMLHRAIRLAPAEAWPHYALGLDLIQLGRDEEGMAEIKFGNMFSYIQPQPYPLNELASAAQIKIPLGNKRCSGALTLMRIDAPPPFSYLLLKAALRSYLARHPQISPAAAAVWHDFNLRLRLDSDEPIGLLVSTVMTGMLQDDVLEHWELSPSQRDTLLRLRGAIEAFKKKWGLVEYDIDASQQMVLASLAHGENGIYLATWDLLLHETNTVQTCAPILEDMAQLDYSKLGLPAALAKYTPVRHVDLTAKRLARHVENSISNLIPANPAGTWGFEPTQDPTARVMQFLDKVDQQNGK